MSSTALQNFRKRLADVQQLVDAHGALIRLKKAEEAHEEAVGDMKKIGKVIEALVSDPGVGRPPQVQALNGAAIALLSGHLQGFLTDLHEEAATALLDAKVSDLDALLEVAPTRGNPNVDNINRLFASIGFPRILDGISWNRMSNDALKKKLKGFNELRNRIAHGGGETVRKSQVENYMKVWASLAKRLDSKVARQIKKLTGTSPW